MAGNTPIWSPPVTPSEAPAVITATALKMNMHRHARRRMPARHHLSCGIRPPSAVYMRPVREVSPATMAARIPHRCYTALPAGVDASSPWDNAGRARHGTIHAFRDRSRLPVADCRLPYRLYDVTSAAGRRTAGPKLPAG